MTTTSRPPAPQPAGRIPGGVWVLGFVSLLMDISSEMIHSLLPLFMVTVLGEPLHWRHFAAFACIMAAVGFMFGGK